LQEQGDLLVESVQAHHVLVLVRAKYGSVIAPVYCTVL